MLLLYKCTAKFATPKSILKTVICIFGLLLANASNAQITATFSTTPNTNCNGSGCNYTGPSILINEIMMSPNLTYDGSLYEVGTGRQGEWIELYNPNLCEPVDISCYYLGNNATDGLQTNKGAGLVLPVGTIIPPGGFCVLRGINATPVPPANLVANGGNTVEIIPNSSIVCMQGSRLWFPNAGSWFAFYDNNGVAQDAVSWASQSNVAQVPCLPTLTGCGFNGILSNYNSIPTSRKTVIATSTPPLGVSLRRIPDGAAWDVNNYQSPTQGACNATCIPPSASSCTGTATATIAGGTGPFTYLWNDSQAQLTQTATGLCAGTYTVNVSDNGAPAVQFSVVIQDFVPTVTLDLIQKVCIDVPQFPIAVASPTPTGSQTGVFSGAGVTTTNFNPATAGIGTHAITYVFTDEFGCTNSAADQIIVNPLPVLSITGIDNPYCISPTPDVLVVSPTGGTFSGPGITAGTTNFVPSVAGIGTHTLTYAYTDSEGCASSTTGSAQVVALPTPTITAPDNICSTEAAITLSGSPTGGIFTINGTQTTTLNPGTIGSGIQNLSYNYTDANGCNAIATDQIEVFAVPNVTVNVVPSVCIDAGNIVVSTSPATSATGTGVLQGTGLTGNNFNPQTAGVGQYTFTYTYTTSDGCVKTATDDITVNALPVVSISGIDPSYCFSNVPETFTLTPAGGTLSGPGVTNNTFVPSAAGLGTHTLTYSFTDANSCSKSVTANVTVVSVPSPTFTVPDSLCNYAAAITLVGTPAGGIFTVDGTQTATFNPQTAGDGNHAIVYAFTDANNCIAMATESIKVLPRPVLGTDLAAFYCSGTGIVPIAMSPAGGTLTGNFINGNNVDLTGKNPGNYSITYNYTDNKGCENTLNKPFVLTAPIFPNFNYSTDCFQNVTFTNLTNPAGNFTYAWNFDGLPAPVLPNATFEFVEFGNHMVQLTATDSYNCAYDTLKQIYVNEGIGVKDFVVPNVITANGDGINDVLTLPALLEECITYKIFVLNRWGNLVYEMNSAQNAFAGKDKGGKELQEGVYFYIVESDDIDCKSDKYRGFCSGTITIVK